MASRDSVGAEQVTGAGRRKPRPVTERFQMAVAMIKTLPKEGPYTPDNTTKLRFYALYKQATEGPCHISQPGFWDLVGKAKWEAWKVCGNMSQEIAMQLYVEDLAERVKIMPQSTETEDFLQSISPFYEDEEEESGSEGVRGEGGEDVEGEGVTEDHTPLSSSVLHQLDLPRDTGIVSEGGEGEGDGGEGGEEEGGGGEDRSSVSSNDDDYHESFQDMRTSQTVNGELLSPWQLISSESPSPSFELVQSDPEHKTPDTKIPPENPLPPHGGQMKSEFHETMGAGLASSTPPTERLQVGARSKVEGTRRENRSKGSGVSTPTPYTIRHSGDSSGLVSGDGVIVTSGHEQEQTRMTSSSQQTGGDRSTAPSHSLVTVSSQVAVIRERMVELMQQLSTLSQAVQSAGQQYYGPDNTQTSLTGAGSRASRRRWRVRQIVYLSLLLLGWPLLVHTLITFLFKTTTVPLWVWSALSAVHIFLSLLLNYGGFHL